MNVQSKSARVFLELIVRSAPSREEMKTWSVHFTKSSQLTLCFCRTCTLSCTICTTYRGARRRLVPFGRCVFAFHRLRLVARHRPRRLRPRLSPGILYFFLSFFFLPLPVGIRHHGPYRMNPFSARLSLPKWCGCSLHNTVMTRRSKVAWPVPQLRGKIAIARCVVCVRRRGPAVAGVCGIHWQGFRLEINLFAPQTALKMRCFLIFRNFWTVFCMCIICQIIFKLRYCK